MRFNTYQKICLLFFISIVIFWFVLFINNITSGFYNYLYSFLFGLIPLLGGIIGMLNSKIWGGFMSTIGKAVFLIGFGMFLWGSGEMIWSYYNFFIDVPVPYPSLADFFFAPSIFFYCMGTIYLSKTTGAKFGLRNSIAKVFVVVAPIILLVISYYFLIVVARKGIFIQSSGSSFKILLDIAYPLGGFLGLTISILISGLSFKYFGGMYKIDIYSILLGLGVMFIADIVFSYTTQIQTYYNGNFGDLLLTIGTTLITFGLLGFCNEIKNVIDFK